MLSNISAVDGTVNSTAVPVDAHASLSELRAQFEALKKTAAETISRGAQQSQKVVQDGTSQLRAEIQHYPLAAIAVAALAGALIGMALTQPPGRTTYDRMLDRARNALPEIDTAGVRARLADAVGAVGTTTAGLLPSVEHLAQALSRMDATSVAPLVEKGSVWLKNLWELASDARNSLKS